MSDLTLDAEAARLTADKRALPSATIRRPHRVVASGLVWVLPLLVFIGVGFNLPLLMTAAWSLVDQVSGGFTLANYVCPGSAPMAQN